MRNLYQDKKWLIDNPDQMVQSIGGWDNMYTENFYEYIMNTLDSNKIETMDKKFEKFLNSKYQSLSIEDSSRINKI